MGAYSEMDIERQYGDSLFSERPTHSAPETQEPPAWDETPTAAPPAFEDDKRQQAEVEAAPVILAQLNEEQYGKSDGAKDSAEASDRSKDTADDGGEDAKRKAHEEAEAKRNPRFADQRLSSAPAHHPEPPA